MVSTSSADKNMDKSSVLKATTDYIKTHSGKIPQWITDYLKLSQIVLILPIFARTRKSAKGIRISNRLEAFYSVR